MLSVGVRKTGCFSKSTLWQAPELLRLLPTPSGFPWEMSPWKLVSQNTIHGRGKAISTNYYGLIYRAKQLVRAFNNGGKIEQIPGVSWGKFVSASCLYSETSCLCPQLSCLFSLPPPPMSQIFDFPMVFPTSAPHAHSHPLPLDTIHHPCSFEPLFSKYRILPCIMCTHGFRPQLSEVKNLWF